MNYRNLYLVAMLAALGASSPISFAAADEPTGDKPQGSQQQAESRNDADTADAASKQHTAGGSPYRDQGMAYKGPEKQ
jgi:hypothetical protein